MCIVKRVSYKKKYLTRNSFDFFAVIVLLKSFFTTFYTTMLLALFLLASLAEEGLERDVSVDFNIESELKTLQEYDSLVSIYNNDHVTGRTDSLDIKLNFNLSFNGVLKKDFDVLRTINRQASSNTGSLFFNQNGSYELCVYAEPLNFVDYNLSNNFACISLKVSGPEKLKKDFCSCNLSLSLNHKIITEGSQNININYCRNDSTTFKHTVFYWIENLKGEIVRNKVSTTNPSTKTYTPPLIKEQKGYVVKAKVPSCNLSTKEIFLTYKESSQNPFLEIHVPLESKSDNFINLGLEGFKGDTNKRVLDIWLEQKNERKSQIHKVYVNNKNSPFNLAIPFHIPFSEEGGMHTLKVEGLDLEAEERIYIRPSEKNKAYEITNIYTRQLLFREEVNVFVRTNGFRGVVKIVSSAHNESFIAEEDTFNRSVKIKEPGEVIGFFLLDNKEIIHKDFLHLKLRKDEKEEQDKPEKETPRGEDSETSKNNESEQKKDSNTATKIIQNNDSETELKNLFLFGLGGLALLFFLFKKY